MVRKHSWCSTTVASITREYLIFIGKCTPLLPTFPSQTTPNTHTTTSPPHVTQSKPQTQCLPWRWLASFNRSIKKENSSMKPKVNSNHMEITFWHFVLLELVHKLLWSHTQSAHDWPLPLKQLPQQHGDHLSHNCSPSSCTTPQKSRERGRDQGLAWDSARARVRTVVTTSSICIMFYNFENTLMRIIQCGKRVSDPCFRWRRWRRREPKLLKRGHNE